MNGAKQDGALEAAPGRVIAIDRLTKRFGRLTAVEGLTLGVQAGEIVGFLGPNGAGKTTTIRTLMGFLNPTAGGCSVLGGSLRADPSLRRRVGYLPGDFDIDRSMSGRDLFNWFARLRGGVDRRHVDGLIERLRLDPTRRFGNLSKGNRQKVGIVQALMHRPEVLILDEPTSGLDPLIQREFLDLVRGAAADGAAVLFSSHVLPEVEHLASRVAIIRAGRLVTVSTVDALLDRARHRLVLTYAGLVPHDLFSAVPGVVGQEVDHKSVVVTVDGPVGPAMLAASSHPGLLRVANAGDELEELFIDLYEREGNHVVA